MPIIVKNTTFIGLLDLLAPHTCRGCGRTGSALCGCCKNNIISAHTNFCPQCKAPITDRCEACSDLPPTYVVSERSELTGTLIHDLKYHSVRALAKPLAEILDAILPYIKGPVVIVPLPTIRRHIRARGLDHTYLIAKHLAHLRGPNYRVGQLLVRAKQTVQVGASQSARLAQAATAYALNPQLPVHKKATYLLLDDVWTTGATMRSAHQLLKSAGIKNIRLAILAVSRID